MNTEGQNPMWNAILKWSLAQQGDGTSASPVRPMSDEDREFLDKVMADMVVDEVGKMREISLVLRAPETAEGLAAIIGDGGVDGSGGGGDSVEAVRVRKVEALEELEPFVEHIHGACNLHKIGGLVPLVELLDSADSRVVAAAARVLSVVVQNNPETQRLAEEEAGAVRRIVAQLELGHQTSAQRLVLLAASSLVGENAAMAAAFGDQGGLESVRRAWAAEETPHRARARAGLLLLKLAGQLPDRHPVGAAEDVLRGCVRAMNDPAGPNVRETGLRVALEAAKAGAGKTDFFAQAARTKLANLEAISDDEDRLAAEDELRYARELAGLLF